MINKCKPEVDPRPCSFPCEKCGGTDTSLKHRRKGDIWDRPAGDWGRMDSDPPPQGNDLVVYSDYKCEAMKECLTHFCSTCTYEWTTDIYHPNAEDSAEKEIHLKNSTCVPAEPNADGDKLSSSINAFKQVAKLEKAWRTIFDCCCARDMLVLALEDAAAHLHTANVPGAFESGDDLSEYLIDGYEKAHKAAMVNENGSLKHQVDQYWTDRHARRDSEEKKPLCVTDERDDLKRQVDQLNRDSAIQDLENKRKEEVILKLQRQVQILIERFDAILNQSPCENCPAKVVGCTLKCAVTMSDWSLKEANKIPGSSVSDKMELR